MTEGTRSLLFGCHHWLLHPLAVTRAWRRLHRCWPSRREFFCIFVHDWGLWGMNYVSESKAGHWQRGAGIAHRRYGCWAWSFVAGHCPKESHEERSLLFQADKLSWLCQPVWLLALYRVAEPYLTPARQWREVVQRRWEENRFCGWEAHQEFLRLRAEREGGEEAGR